MSARKLGRFAGLVFMVAALVFGASATVSGLQASGGSSTAAASLSDINWG